MEAGGRRLRKKRRGERKPREETKWKKRGEADRCSHHTEEGALAKLQTHGNGPGWKRRSAAGDDCSLLLVTVSSCSLSLFVVIFVLSFSCPLCFLLLVLLFVLSLQ